MSNFIKITQKFADFKTLSGLAIFSSDGRFIDTSLPLSDEFSEDIGQYFYEMLSSYREQGRVNNRFVVETSQSTLLYAEHSKGAFLFMVEGNTEIDAIFGAFSHLYPATASAPAVSVVERPSTRVEEAPLALSEQAPKKSIFRWAIPGAVAAAVALTVSISGVASNASAQGSESSIEKSMLDASIEREAAAKEAQAKAEMKAAEAIAIAEKLEMERQKEIAMAAEKASTAHRR